MVLKTQSIFSQIAYVASKEIPLPFALIFMIRMMSNLQVISLILSESILTQNDDHISKSIGYIISDIKSASMIFQISQETMIKIIAYVCCLYCLFKFVLIISLVVQLHRKREPNYFLSKSLALVSLIHNQVIFAPLFSFILRLINLHFNCELDESSQIQFYCETQWLVVSCLAGVFHLALGVTKELYWYQIPNKKNSFNTKDNLYPLIIFAQKALILSVMNFLDKLKTFNIILNIVFSLLGLYVLQTRLPFYDLKVLKLETSLNSVNLLFSLLMITQISNSQSNILLVIILMIPLGIKSSLGLLEVTIRKIIKARPKDSYKAVHLPILVETFLRQSEKLPKQKKSNKNALILSGFVQNYRNCKESSDNTEMIAHIITIDKLDNLLRTSPRDQLLLISMAQIYINKIKHIPKAIYLLNQLKAQNLTIPMKNSLKDLFLELENIYLKACNEPTENLNYLKYFEYREQTKKLKDLIQQEVTQHTKLWEILNESCINVYRVIAQAEAISLIQNRIQNLWQKEIKGLEKEFLNASILYETYLEIVQDSSQNTLSLTQKSYHTTINKNLTLKRIHDISMGRSAIIVASIEPENSGKIIDASSSVKNLFGISRDNLVGLNMNTILLKTMANKHNMLIQNFYEKFTYNLQSKFASYARSLDGKYFPVEVDLHVFPSLKKGLNIVAYITKQAESTPIIIVNFDGKILETSKDLDKLLTSNGSESYLDLGKICPEFNEVNHAFNVVYGPEKNKKDTIDDDSQKLYESEPYSGTLKFSESRFKESLLNSPKDTVCSTDFLITNKDYQETLKTNLLRVEKVISPSSPKTEGLTFTVKKPKEAAILMTREEAEIICNQFKERKTLKLDFSSYINKSRKEERSIFEAKIEPLSFAGALYKVIKLEKSKEALCEDSSLSKLVFSKRKYDIEILLAKKHSANVRVENLNTKEKDLLYEKNTATTSNQRLGIDTQLSNEKMKKEDVKGFSKMEKPKAKNNGRDQGIYLNNFLKNNKISPFTKLAVIIVFLSVLVVLVSVCGTLVFSRNSLKEMDDSINLIYLTNTRLFRLLAAWRGVLILYSRSVKLRPDNAALMTQYRGVIKNSSLEMVKNNNMLRGLVDEFSDNLITRKFYEKKISLWLPYENVTVNRKQVDLFTANQIIFGKNMFVANFSQSLLNLKNRSEVLFALNNTANDYLIAVSESISDVNNYFDNIYMNSLTVLRLSLLFENLALLMSFTSLIVLFITIIKNQKHLFQVISQIKKQNIQQRIAKLNSFAEYLKEDAEDCIILYRNDISKISTESKPVNNKIQRLYIQSFSLKNLIWNMNKYLLFAFLSMTLIVALFWVSYIASIQGFEDLSRINSQILTTYEFGGQISSILSNFYYVLIFASEPIFKIRNQPPAKQLTISINFLREASDSLLSSLSTPGIGIEDPDVENLLKNDLCRYMTPENKQICLTNTNYNSIGLLGMNAKFYRTCGLPILDYLAYPTATRGKSLLDNIVGVLGDMHMISFDGYEALAQLLIANFKQKVEEKEADSLKFFKYNLIVILIMMLLIAILVIRRYQNLDLAVKKILRIIPYEIIEKNKQIIHYLSKTYPSEFKNAIMR